MTDDDLREVSAEWIAVARAAWPDIALDGEAFVASIVARLPADVDRDVAVALHAADLWLAAGCAAGDPRALAAFDERYLAPLAVVLAPIGLAQDQIDEVRQELRRKLLVADEGLPRIADYSGRADLRIWVRTAATRAAIDLARSRRDVTAEEDELAELPALEDDPELAHLKVRYRGELRSAIEVAVARLEPRERLLLKYHYVDGLAIDGIGEIHGVHRATAARWLTSAREALAEHTHRVLISRLKVTSSELRSIARLVESQLDLDVRTLLD